MAVFLAALAGALGFVWWRQGETTTAAIATAAAVWFAVAILSVPWVLRQWRSIPRSPDDGLNELASKLAQTVRKQWEQEADIRQPNDPHPLALRWAPSKPALMDWPEVIAAETDARRRRSDQTRATRLALTGTGIPPVLFSCPGSAVSERRRDQGIGNCRDPGAHCRGSAALDRLDHSVIRPPKRPTATL